MKLENLPPPHAVREALEDLRARSEALCTQIHGRLSPDHLDECLPSPAEIQVALIWEQIRHIEGKYFDVLTARMRWKFLCRTHSGAGLSRIYKNDAGELAHVPDAFCAAFISGQPLDVDLTSSPESQGQLLVTRAGAVEAQFPIALLDHLVAEREPSMSPRDGGSEACA